MDVKQTVVQTPETHAMAGWDRLPTTGKIVLLRDFLSYQNQLPGTCDLDEKRDACVNGLPLWAYYINDSDTTPVIVARYDQWRTI